MEKPWQGAVSPFCISLVVCGICPLQIEYVFLEVDQLPWGKDQVFLSFHDAPGSEGFTQPNGNLVCGVGIGSSAPANVVVLGAGESIEGTVDANQRLTEKSKEWLRNGNASLLRQCIVLSCDVRERGPRMWSDRFGYRYDSEYHHVGFVSDDW